MDGHINLLQPDRLEVGKKVSTQKGLLFVFIVLIVLISGGLYSQDQKKGAKLFAEVETIRKQRDELLRQVEAISSVAPSTVEGASSPLDSVSIDAILKERTPWSHILREFSFIVPKGIWITEMKNVAGEGLRIIGFSKSHKKVTEMMASMETSRFFEDVSLEFSRQNTGQDRFDFSIHSGIRRGLSQDLGDG